MSEVGQVLLSSGVTLEYESQGVGDRPFVLVHGFTGSRDDFREQVAPLSRHGRTIALDQRGHGGSTNTGDAGSYTLDQLALDLRLALDALGVGRCDLLGHSLGGMVALRFTLANADRVSSLILMDTAARGTPILPKALMEGARKIARESGLVTLSTLMREGMRKNRGAAPASLAAMDAMGFDAWWRRIEAKYEQMDPAAFLALGPALSEQASLVPRLGEIRCPTTVIVGEQDVHFLVPSDELEAGIGGAVRVTIPDAAHSPQLENAAAWREAVEAHLSRARG
jgi:2-succinyl-6-hydroxy-2,4-cyclohexadiene-1-carboxylate synthase